MWIERVLREDGPIRRAGRGLARPLRTPYRIAAALIFVCAAVYRISLVFTADLAALRGRVSVMSLIYPYNEMAAKKFFDTTHGPLYPLFLMIVRGLSGGDGLRAIFFLQGLVSLGSAGLAFVCVRRMGHETAAPFAAALVAFYPPMIAASMVSLPITFCVATIFIMMTVSADDTGERIWTVLSAAAGAVGVLLYPMMIFFVPGLAVTARRRLLFLAVFAVLILPWGIRNSIVEGKAVPFYTAGAYEINLRYYTDADEGWKVAEGLYSNAASFLRRAHPLDEMPVIFGDRFNNHHLLRYSYVVIMLFGLGGIIAFLRRRDTAVVLPSAGFVLITLFLTRYETRYRVFVGPIFLLYTSIVLGYYYSKLAERIPFLKRGTEYYLNRGGREG